jgi:hypothetical protein
VVSETGITWAFPLKDGSVYNGHWQMDYTELWETKDEKESGGFPVHTQKNSYETDQLEVRKPPHHDAIRLKLEDRKQKEATRSIG